MTKDNRRRTSIIVVIAVLVILVVLYTQLDLFTYRNTPNSANTTIQQKNTINNTASPTQDNSCISGQPLIIKNALLNSTTEHIVFEELNKHVYTLRFTIENGCTRNIRMKYIYISHSQILKIDPSYEYTLPSHENRKFTILFTSKKLGISEWLIYRSGESSNLVILKEMNYLSEEDTPKLIISYRVNGCEKEYDTILDILPLYREYIMKRYWRSTDITVRVYNYGIRSIGKYGKTIIDVAVELWNTGNITLNVINITLTAFLNNVVVINKTYLYIDKPITLIPNNKTRLIYTIIFPNLTTYTIIAIVTTKEGLIENDTYTLMRGG